MKICPTCRTADHVHRSRTEGLLEQRLLVRIGVKPFRCSRCKERFYRWSWKAAEPDAAEERKLWDDFLSQHDAGFEEVVERIARREAEMDEADGPGVLREGVHQWRRRGPALAVSKKEENVHAH